MILMPLNHKKAWEGRHHSSTNILTGQTKKGIRGRGTFLELCIQGMPIGFSRGGRGSVGAWGGRHGTHNAPYTATVLRNGSVIS